MLESGQLINYVSLRRAGTEGRNEKARQIEHQQAKTDHWNKNILIEVFESIVNEFVFAIVYFSLENSANAWVLHDGGWWNFSQILVICSMSFI